MKNQSRPYYSLLVISFFAGFIILSLELLSFRLLAPWFGNTIYVWGILIGLILFALSAGYYAGGRIVDSYPRQSVLFTIILISAGYLLVVSLTYYRLMHALENSVLIGAAVSVAVLFFPPMFLLSMVSPFLIKLMQKEENMGTIAGTIFCVSTLGSLAGTLLTSFFFIPYWGSHFTLALNVVLTTLIASAGLKNRRSLAAVAAFPLLMFVPGSDMPGEIYRAESPYNLVTLIQEDEFLGLIVGPLTEGFDTYYDPNDPFRETDYVNIVSTVPALNSSQNALILGLAGGHSARQLLEIYPSLRIDAVEIDPQVIHVARQFYGLREGERLTIIEDDARPFLSKGEKKYDFIEVDIFQGDIFVPFYLTSKEFFQKVSGRLTDRGIMVINILDSEKRRLSQPISNTMAAVFPSVFFLGDNSNNYIYMASKNSFSKKHLINKLQKISTPHLMSVVSQIRKSAQPVRLDNDKMIFTDDFAPVNRLALAVKRDWREER